MSYFGSIHVEPALAGKSSGQVEAGNYLWTPPFDLETPAGFGIEFKLWRDLNGCRRLAIRGNREEFCIKAAHAGLQILVHQQLLSTDEAWYYRAMFLTHQVGQLYQERIKNDRLSAADLVVRRAARGGGVEANLLPNSLRPDGAPVSVAALMEEGYRLAKTPNIDPERAVVLALTDAARVQPILGLSAQQIRSVVRNSLFDLSHSAECPVDVREEVAARFFRLMNRHLDDTTEAFNRWCLSRSRNLEKAIANRRPKLERPQVKRAMLDIVWDAYDIVARCHHAFARWLSNCMNPAFNAAEQELFDQAYFRQPYLGDLPIVLLADRGPLIADLVTGLWESPHDPQLAGVLHRLLQWFGEIASMRRLADRRAKNQLREFNGMQFDFAAASDTAGQHRFDEIARRIAASRGLRCDNCDEWGWLLLGTISGDTGNEFLFELECGCERNSREVQLTGEEFVRLGADS